MHIFQRNPEPLMNPLALPRMSPNHILVGFMITPKANVVMPRAAGSPRQEPRRLV